MSTQGVLAEIQDEIAAELAQWVKADCDKIRDSSLGLITEKISEVMRRVTMRVYNQRAFEGLQRPGGMLPSKEEVSDLPPMLRKR